MAMLELRPLDQHIPAAGSGDFVPRCWVETDGCGERQQRTTLSLLDTAVTVFSSAANNRSWKRNLTLQSKAKFLNQRC